jgi:hypothetical protein
MLEDGTSYAGSAKRCLASFVSNQGNNKAITKPFSFLKSFVKSGGTEKTLAVSIHLLSGGRRPCAHIFRSRH